MRAWRGKNHLNQVPQVQQIDALEGNPLTKEPKLASAMRIAPEWTGYDQEVRLLQERVAQSPSATPPSQGPTDPTDSSEPSESTHDHQEL